MSEELMIHKHFSVLLEGNSLEGAIPTEIGLLDSLKEVNFGECDP